jgi:hypothetical protein
LTQVITPNKEEAKVLFELGFGKCPPIRRYHRLYGIQCDGLLVAATMVNTKSLEKWCQETAYAPKETPEAAISLTMVHPDYQRKGLATVIRKHIQGTYSSLVTGMGAYSNREAMRRLNESTGFRCIWKHGLATCWYWRSDFAAPKTVIDSGNRTTVYGFLDFRR